MRSPLRSRRRALANRIERFRELPAGERRALRDRIENLFDATPEKSSRMQRNLARWRELSPEERD
ncbi:MAG: DUF3106 domain-containing protein, partial [Myxococcales bacterium]|nr:DUF3106 domain-containing protein [Myxococcales bacterium]